MELLSPCGTIESLISAVAAGTNAVYLGLGELNARAKSVDFNTDNLKQWTDYCHLFGVKVYVTLNTEVFQNELTRMRELVDFIINAGCDAIISTDLAVLDYSKSNYPDFQIHVSTQSGVRNKAGALFFKELGADRVVCARECSLEDIKEIASVIETEVFVHGALCVSFSGNCLLSEYIGGNSANRGRCKQPCRKDYVAKTEKGVILKKGKLLSAKDIALDGYLDELEKIGVASLKIEGRLKSPEYVYATTNYYKRLLKGEKADRNELLLTYNRGGFTPSYFKGNNVIYTLTSNHVGLKIGSVKNILKKGGFTFAEINANVDKGDGLKVLRKGLEVGGSDVTSAQSTPKGTIVPISADVKIGDTVSLTKSKSYQDEVSKKKAKLNVDFEFSFSDKAYLKAGYKEISVVVSKDYDKSSSLDDEKIKAQLIKTGETDFNVENVQIVGSGYLPKSALNALRNQALQELRSCIIATYLSPKSENYSRSNVKEKQKINGDIYEIDSLRQNLKANNIVYSPKFLDIEFVRKNLLSLKEKYRVYLKYPRLLDEKAENELLKVCKDLSVGVYADNYGNVQKARVNGLNYIAGFGLNVSNEITLKYFKDADAVIKSFETTEDKSFSGYSFVYGFIPLMTFEHCPNATSRGVDCKNCKNKGNTIYYDDGVCTFPLRAVVGDRCYYTLYSDKVLDIKYKTDLDKYVSLVGENSK